MPSRRMPEPKGPDWPADRTLRVLRQQLEALQQFRGKRYSEVRNEEVEWVQFTKNVIIHGFGESCQNIINFERARHAGMYSRMGTSEGQSQKNYKLRIDGFHGTLASSIRELEASLPEAEIRGAYEAGEDFAFYLDLKGILAAATNEVFIIDNYLSLEFFELYVAPVSKGVSVRLLTGQIRGNLEAVAKKFAARGNFELRSSQDVHDRHAFVDGRGWMIGQSIKDAAKKKPTYMVETGADAVGAMKTIYEAVWAQAATVVKG